VSLSHRAVRSFEDNLDYAYFLFVSNLLPLFIIRQTNSAVNWIMKSIESYPECLFFKFLLGYSLPPILLL
jgi:hypothetical protein